MRRMSSQSGSSKLGVRSRARAILGRNKQQTMGLKSLAFRKKLVFGAVPVFLVAFVAAFFASSVLAPVNTSDATSTLTANVSYANYYVLVSASDVEMDLLATPSGRMTVASTTVKAATNSPNGYELYIGMSDLDEEGEEKSAADKLKTGLYLDGDLSRTDGEVFSAASGTGGTSGTLAALTDNTWGYAVDKNATGAPDIWTTEDHSTMESATPTSDKFAGVPAYGSEELIQETDEGNVPYDTDEEDVEDSDYTSATLYYGIRGNTGKSAGAYSNTIAYTAVAKSAPAGSLTFSPATYTRTATYEEMTWDDELVITTPIVTSATDLVTAEVYLSGGPENVSNLACSDPTLSIDGNNYLTVTCTLPAAYAGTYDIVVWIENYGQVYTDTYTYDVTWETISAMQEMTSAVCDSAGTVTTSTTTVPEVYLTDLRGGGGHITGTKGNYSYSASYTGKYRIRKLADGKCWMTENMDLPFTSTSEFHSYDTNLTTDPSDSSIDLGSYSTDDDGNLVWTPTAVGTVSGGDTTCTVYNTTTSARDDADCSPDTITATDSTWCYNNNQGPIDTNNKNAHNYQGPGCTYGTPGALSNKYTTDYDGVTQDIGSYYNWAAATAQSGGDTAGTNAPNSICPKGWGLADGAGTSVGSYYYLITTTYGYADSAAGSNSARSYPVSLAYTGCYTWGSGYLGYLGRVGYWWSASPSTFNAYRLIVDSSRLAPQYNTNKLSGFSVRCVSL